MIIRFYAAGDAGSLAKLYRQSVEQIGRRDYSEAQINAWALLAPSAERQQALCTDGRIRLVAVDAADRPTAFVDLEADGHIHFLYCPPEAAGRGVASALYDRLGDGARQRGIALLYAEASEAARRFFLKKGFTAVAWRDFEISGIPIHNYAAEKHQSAEKFGQLN